MKPSINDNERSIVILLLTFFYSVLTFPIFIHFLIKFLQFVFYFCKKAEVFSLFLFFLAMCCVYLMNPSIDNNER